MRRKENKIDLFKVTIPLIALFNLNCLYFNKSVLIYLYIYIKYYIIFVFLYIFI